MSVPASAVDYATRRRDLLKLLVRNCQERGCTTCTLVGKPRCHHCGKKAPSWQALEIDHLDGKGWVSRKVNSYQRLRIMERETATGSRLVGSCGHCNHSSGATRRYKWKTRRRRDRGGAGYTNYAVGYAAHLAAQLERDSYRAEVNREREAAREQWAQAEEAGDDPGAGRRADRAGEECDHPLA